MNNQSRKLAKQYLESKIMNASKEELLLMLFDGAITFVEQAKEKIEFKDYEGKNRLLIKSQRIMMELTSAVRKEVMPPEIYKNLVGLYNFVYFRLVWGNLKNDVKQLDEALQILGSLRNTWALAIDKNSKEEVNTLNQGNPVKVIKVPDLKNRKIAMDLQG